MKSIVWVESHICNNRCPYCAIFRLSKDKHDDWQGWVDRLNAFNPKTIDITGGEPFLNPHLVDIIKGLKAHVGLTTNATLDLTRFVQEVSPGQVVSMTLSYHPSQNTINREQFVGKCLMLMHRGFNITVNFVAFPEQMWMIPVLAQFFKGYGIRFHVDPYQEIKEYPYRYNRAELELLTQCTGSDRAFRFDAIKESTVFCSGGQDHMVIHPNGDAYRCMGLSLYGGLKMGNIFDAGFTAYAEGAICTRHGICGGCDKDKVTITQPMVTV